MLAAGVLMDRRRVDARGGVSAALGLMGLSLVGLGAIVPWLTLFAGLEAVPGYRLDGGYLSGIAIASATFTLLAARLGSGRILRAAGVGTGLIVGIDAAYVTTQIASFVGDPGPAGPLSQPAIGPGAPLMAIGALLLVGAAAAAPIRTAGLTRSWGRRIALAIALFAAGWIHLVLTPEHLDEATLLGLGFGAAGLVQVVLAGVILVRPGKLAYVAIIVANVALLALYAYAVLIGLPFGGHDHGSGLRIGAGEDVDFVGVVSLVAELIGVLVAMWLLGRQSGRQAAGR